MIRIVATHTTALNPDLELLGKAARATRLLRERAQQRFGRWVNKTGRAIDVRTVRDWTHGQEKTLPVEWREDAEAAGLTYLGLPSL